MSQLVILGRDGVINQVVEGSVLSPEDFQAIPGSLEAIARLNHAGLRIAVATNQPGIARSLLDIETLDAIHSHLQQRLARVGGHLDGIFICPHDSIEKCDCHKPATGLLQAISERFSSPLGEPPFIGDDLADMDAARRAGAIPMLVRSGQGIATLKTLPDNEAVFVSEDLAHAVEHLLSP